MRFHALKWALCAVGVVTILSAGPADLCAEDAMPLDRTPALALLVAAAALAAAGPATADTVKIASAPITQSGGSLIECSIVNISGAAATVTIRVISNDVQLATAGPASVPGGMSRSADAFCSGTCVRPRCTFQTSAPAAAFRASACIADHTATNTNKICVPAQ